MGTMDHRGFTWIGSIYQKFEAMCLEIEEAISQELLPPSSNQFSQKTAKYVENQVQAVGASMKKLCSEVVQELLPPSCKDPLKASSADLLLNPYLEFELHMKPKSVVKEDAKTPVSIKNIAKDDNTQQADTSNSGYEVWEDWGAAQFNWEFSDDEAGSDQTTVKASNENVQCESREEPEGNACNSSPNVLVVSPASSGAVLDGDKKGESSRSISASHSLRAEHTEWADTYGNSGLVPLIGLHAGLNSPDVQAAADVTSSDTCGNNMLVHQIGSQTSANTPILQADDGLTDTDSKSKLEETCVLVDGKDIRLIAHKEEKSRSYKKIVQAAFSLKTKPTRKQEYKQLAARYGNMNAESNMKGEEPIVPKNSAESEWELI